MFQAFFKCRLKPVAAASDGIFVQTSILRQCIYRIEFGCLIGGHKAERDADSGRTGDRPDNGCRRNVHREIGYKMIEHEADGGGQTYADQASDDAD